MARWEPKQRDANRKPRVFGRNGSTLGMFMTISPQWWYCTNTRWTGVYYSKAPDNAPEKQILEKFLMDVRIINDFESLILIHLKSEAEVELFLNTANKIGLQLKSLAYGIIPEKDRPYEVLDEEVRVHKPHPKPKVIPQTRSTKVYALNEFTKFSEYLQDVSRVYAFQRMSKVENGTLIMKPFNESSRKWAESIKQMLASHKVTSVVIE